MSPATTFFDRWQSPQLEAPKQDIDHSRFVTATHSLDRYYVESRGLEHSQKSLHAKLIELDKRHDADIQASYNHLEARWDHESHRQFEPRWEEPMIGKMFRMTL